ncbi:MAG: DUF4192 family protein [Streptosporangiales bacterium]|nr:DUF4192 family protein [Streptosporangiales bacterium]
MASVRFGSPLSRTTRTASATVSPTDSPAPTGVTENATITVEHLSSIVPVTDSTMAGTTSKSSAHASSRWPVDGERLSTGRAGGLAAASRAGHPAGMRNQPTSNEPPVLRLRSPEDLLAAVPYILGFHPSDSLVALGFAGPRGRITFTTRVDLPEPDHAGGTNTVAAHVAGTLDGNAAETVMLVAYGPRRGAEPVLDLVRDRLGDLDIPVREVLLVVDGRYWSLCCDDPRCCPPEGKPCDPASSMVPAQAMLAGLTALPDRAALERSVAAAPGAVRDAIKQATRSAEIRLNDEWAGAASGQSALRRRLLDEGRRMVRDALGRYRRAGGSRLTDDEVALLGLLLTLQAVRDEAWLLIDADWRDAHLELWTDVVRRVEEVYAPAPACLLGFAAWQDGNGALAQVALGRAFEADPDYSMAHLIHDALVRGVPPVRWPQMSVQELRAMYDRREPPPDATHGAPRLFGPRRTSPSPADPAGPSGGPGPAETAEPGDQAEPAGPGDPSRGGRRRRRRRQPGRRARGRARGRRHRRPPARRRR